MTFYLRDLKEVNDLYGNRLCAVDESLNIEAVPLEEEFFTDELPAESSLILQEVVLIEILKKNEIKRKANLVENYEAHFQERESA